MIVHRIRAAIIDDEQESLDLLEKLLLATGEVEIVGMTLNSEQAAEFAISAHPEILFMDVKMPGKDGFEILDELRRKRYFSSLVVFTTAFDEFALKAFEYAAFDYLLKPVDPDRLAETLERFHAFRMNEFMHRVDLLLNTLKKLAFNTLNGIVFIDPKEVVYIEADGNYSHFHLGNKKVETVTTNLGHIELQVDPEIFYRADRSKIVNLTFLKKVNISKHQCVFEMNGEEIFCQIAREKMGELISRMKEKYI
jgi:two-component system LytT family response regulator